MLEMVLLLCFIAILVTLYAVFYALFYRERSVEKLKFYGNEQRVEVEEQPKKPKMNLLHALSQLVPTMLIGKNRREKLELSLLRAGLQIKPEELFVIKMFSSSIIAFLFLPISRDIFICLVVFILVWLIPKMVINHKQAQRLKLFDEQINEGIMIISNSLKAGYSFLQAVSVVTEETKDPFSKEFKKLFKEMTLGISMEDSLAGLMKRVPSEDLRLIVNAILIQKDIGGNLSEILDNISGTIRERQKIQNELKTLTAQGKLSGIVIVSLPFVLGGIIYVFNKEYMSLLFTTSMGIGMIVSALISQLIGIFLIKKIIKIEM